MLRSPTEKQVHALRDEIEDDLLDVVSDAMRGWLLRVRAAVLKAIEGTGPLPLLAASGDDIPSLGEMAGWWAESVDNDIVLAVNEALEKAWTQWTDQVVEANLAQEATNSYVAGVRNRLVEGSYFGVPVYADSFDRIRVSLAENLALGGTRDELAQRIAAELSWETDGPYWRDVKSQMDGRIDKYLDSYGPPGSSIREQVKRTDPIYRQMNATRTNAVKHLDAERSVWQMRATLIARTEATGGANFGAFRALKAEGVGTKVWVSTVDARTRPSHIGANDQEVQIDRPFVVGGALLQFPGDPAGPVTEVANCRCAMVAGDFLQPVPGFAAPTAQAPVAGADTELAALEKKWKGKPAPKPPKGLPEKPHVGKPLSTSAQMQNWVEKVNTRYRAYSGKENLVYSGDFEVTASMLEVTASNPNATRGSFKAGVDYLYNGKYIDDALRAEIRQIWEDAARIDPEVLAKYKHEVALAKRRLRGHKYAMDDWRRANGIPETGPGRGMDGARVFDDEGTAIHFANDSLPTVRQGAAGARAIEDYTGSYYDTVNRALHRKALEPEYRISAQTKGHIEDVEDTMEVLGHDIYLHRGTHWREFEFPDGFRTSTDYEIPPDPMALLGTVQHQPGFMSTSVGTEPAFSSKPVHILFRPSATTRGVNVMQVGSYGSAEREILLQRGLRYYVHSVREEYGRWLIEAEILEDGADLAALRPTPLTSKVNRFGPSGS